MLIYIREICLNHHNSKSFPYIPFEGVPIPPIYYFLLGGCFLLEVRISWVGWGCVGLAFVNMTTFSQQCRQICVFVAPKSST